jgi:ribonuclease J
MNNNNNKNNSNGPTGPHDGQDAVSEFKQLVNQAMEAEAKGSSFEPAGSRADQRASEPHYDPIPASSEDESLGERFDHDDVLPEDQALDEEVGGEDEGAGGGMGAPDRGPHGTGPAGHDGDREQKMRLKNARNRMRPRPMGSPQKHSMIQKSNPNVAIPPVAPGTIRVIPLGGVEEIGMNMSLVEIGNDIIVIDAGFKFKDSDHPGIDYILPNTKYLEERKHKIRAMLVTHGHLDHIGALPFIMERIGNPPIYTRNLTALMLRKRQAEFPHVQPFEYRIIEGNERVKIGELSVQFYGVSHSIPDSMGIAIETPHGYVTTPGDFKLDHRDGVPTEKEEQNYSLFDGKNVLLYLGESTNIENPGFSTPDYIVNENLEEIVKHSTGRLIMGMFSSHVNRIAHVIHACERMGKKVIIEGRSMKNNVDITIQAGILKVNKNVFIAPQDIDQYPPDRIVIIATGAQGEEFAFLMRISNNQYKHFKLSDRDTVVLSSSIVPGNEKAVQKLKDSIARQGAKIMHYRTSDVYIHSTGHGNRGEMEWLHRKMRAKFFVPIHGHHYMLKLHAEMAEQLGIPKQNICVPDDGTIIEIQDGGTKMVRLAAKAPDNVVMVDGFTIGDIQDVVIRDRQILSQDGIYVVVGVINAATGRLKKSPDIISRGSVYLRESQELLREIRFLVKNTVEEVTREMHPVNIDYVKDVVSDVLGRFIFQQTAKRPIIIPVMICV